jgi:hypothetical protein
MSELRSIQAFTIMERMFDWSRLSRGGAGSAEFVASALADAAVNVPGWESVRALELANPDVLTPGAGMNRHPSKVRSRGSQPNDVRSAAFSYRPRPRRGWSNRPTRPVRKMWSRACADAERWQRHSRWVVGIDHRPNSSSGR